MSRRIIVGVTGASGSVYARLLVDALTSAEVTAVDEVALIFSENGKRVWEYEVGKIDIHSPKIKQYPNDDLFAPAASGSAGYDAMIIIPCSMGTLSRIASGHSDGLICRAADVMLKERKKLILVTREAPLSLIHIENMGRVTQAGGIIFPASPSFYGKPGTQTDLLMTVVSRVLGLINVPVDIPRWGENS